MASFAPILMLQEVRGLESRAMHWKTRLAIYHNYFYIRFANPQTMTFFIIILGIVIFYLIVKTDKQAPSNPPTSNINSSHRTGRQTEAESPRYMTTQDVRAQRAKMASWSNLEKTVNKPTVFQDETIIEVSPDPVRISYENYYADFESRSVYTPAYDADEYKLGKKYKEKLALTKQEVGWLNKFWNDANVFNSIEGCETEIVKLYIASIKKINSFLKKEASTLSREIEAIAQKSLEFQKSQTTYWTDYDVRNHKESVEKEAYQVIYKRCESVVRDQWNHKRKIQAEFYPYSPEIKALFDERLAVVIDDAVKKCSPHVGEPDDLTEIALNETGTGRWKIYFEAITKNQLADENETISQLYRLGELNSKNPHVEHVFYEASKFLATRNKAESLRFYLHYIWHDLNSKQVDSKQLNKTIQKRLFSKQQEFEQFQSIVDELVNTKDLQKALTGVSSIYAPKRRSIAIDISAVQLVEKQHAGTVSILSQYLRDENELVSDNLESPTDGELIIVVDSASPPAESNVEESAVNLSAVQRQCLQLFESEEFSVEFDKIESFAKQNGLFKNQLIDGINDQCMELLDDVLIEENEEGFEVNVNYYKKIFAA